VSARDAFEAGVGQLAKFIGAEEGEAMVKACLMDTTAGQVSTPGDLMEFALALVKRGGLCELVGRTLKVKALLLGAALDGK
jgi:hypothetical protein